MRVVSLLLVAVAIFATLANAAPSWTMTGIKASIMFGLSFVDDNNGFVTTGTSIINTKDGKTFKNMKVQQSTLMVLAVAAQTANSSVLSGVALGSTANQYTTDGETYQVSDDTLKAQVDECQDVENGWDVNTYLATGVFGMKHGIAVSTNGGAHFTKYDWDYSNAMSSPRYSSSPSSSVWYISGGAFPESNDTALYSTHGITHRSKYVHIKNGQVGSEPSLILSPPTVDPDTVGFLANIQKTTDGGKSFTTVFEDLTSGFYFNEIDCPTVDICFAAAEGDIGAYIYNTVDGGKTWNVQMTAPAGESLTAVSMMSATEGYVAGAMLTGKLMGHVYYTSDAGATWTLQAPVKGAYIQDLAFTSAVTAWATCITPAQVGELIRFE